jgi:CelD/BcsL family acetyltransferase involved in cellulose biosynthesis
MLNPGYRVRIVTEKEVSPTMVSAWSELESRSIEPNAYLSPHFVLPAIRHLDPGANVLIALVGRGSTDLAGVGIFRSVSGTRAFPLPHLVAYQSRHSFLNGLLLDRQHAAQALDALFDHLRAMRWWWHGLEFGGTWGDGPLSELINTTAVQRGISRHTWNMRARAILVPSANPDSLDTIVRSRDAGRRMRRLQECGEVRWTLHRQGGIPERSVETFLDLEHRGWKGESKTSLRSNPADEAFFREAVSRFGAVDRAFFTELSLDNRVIASTSNFISGDVGFAFKIGWLPDLAKLSPGVLNEIELIRRVRQGVCSDLTFLDSGASEGSFIDKLWPSRRPLVSLAIASTCVSQSVLGIVRTARAVKRRLQAFASPTPR